MSSSQITLAEVIELAPGQGNEKTWVNGEFEAVVSNVKVGRGKSPSTATLSDHDNPNIKITGKFFGRDPSHLEGCLCSFGGKGMTRSEYKDNQEVTFGDKATINVIGRINGDTKCAAKTATAPRQTAPQAASGVSLAFHGATVGMALNQAAECLRCTWQGAPKEAIHSYLVSTEFSKDLHTVASDILRVSAMLEAGKLAPSAKHRADPKLAEKEAADAAERQRKADEAARLAAEAEAAAKAAADKSANIGDNSDEDVPF